MDLINEKVNHVSLGAGTIIDVNKKDGSLRYSITVLFDTQSEKVFHFPDAFDSGFLTSNSDCVDFYLKKAKKDSTCTVCGRYEKELFSREDKICSKCIENTITCRICKKRAVLGKTAVQWHDGYYCETCFNIGHTKCNICKKYADKEDFINSKYLNIKVCNMCAQTHLEQCVNCNVFLPYELCQLRDNSLYCPQCAERLFSICQLCGNEMVKLSDNDKLCFYCSKKASYKGYLEHLDFSSLVSEIYSFNTFKQMDSVLLMSRLRHYFSNSPDNIDENKKPFDVLLIRTVMGTLIIMYEICKEMEYLRQSGNTVTQLKKKSFITCLMIIHGT